jgi:glycosyltransferase involved in cell wall biosynthesis
MAHDRSAVALLSYCCDTGVGVAGYDFYSHLPFSRWIIAPHRTFGVSARRLDQNCVILDAEPEAQDLAHCLDGITALFCIERPYVRGLFSLAHERGIRLILMPNAEWFAPDDPEMALVDTFIAPTLACAEYLRATGFDEKTVYVPHPIDTSRFQFRRRDFATSFLHCHGWGGYLNRKGTDIFLTAARDCPDIPFFVAHQARIRDPPENVVLSPATLEPELQYVNGDICIQPSRWEGVGLQILEAMSCGLPTLIPDAPPMNEYLVSGQLCVPASPKPIKIGGRDWVQWEVDPHHLTSAIRDLHKSEIAELSIASRRFAEARSWDELKPSYSDILGI